MNFESIPIIKIELQNMKHSIMTHLGAAGSQLGDAIDERLQRAIEDYDFDGVVSSAANEAITDCIESFFRYGDGNSCIKKAVNDALNETFKKIGAKK